MKIPTPAQSFMYEELCNAIMPCVYGWRRQDEYLYIGMSTNGISRPLSRNHHVLGGVSRFEPDDALDIWRFIRASDAGRFERLLIARLRPKFNGMGTGRHHSKSLDVNQKVSAQLKCQECKYQWTPRSVVPLRCPNPLCQSIFWNGAIVKGGYPKKKVVRV